MEPQNPGTNANPNPAASPVPGVAAAASAPGAAPVPQPTPQAGMPEAATAPAAPQPAPPATPFAAPAAEQPAAPGTAPMPQAPGAVPQQPAMPAPGVYPTMGGAMPAADKPKKFKLAIVAPIVALAIAVLGVGGYFAYNTFLAGIKLTEYKGDGYSLLVPADYEQERGGGGTSTRFSEDAPEESRSKLVASGEATQRPLTDNEVDQVIAILKESAEEEVTETLEEKEGYKAKEVKVSNIKHKGHEALKVTANIEKDGKHVGRAVALLVVSNKGVYGLTFVVHHQDTKLDKKVDTIIESFEVDQ